MKIAIIDDSAIHREKIRSIVEKEYAKENISSFRSIREYEKSDGFYDLLLLDVELSDEQGIDYIKSYPQRHRYVIYVSSHAEYMRGAFGENVLGFVPKEQMDTLLLDEIHHAEEILGTNITYNIQTIYGMITIEERKIVYFDYVDKRIYLHMEAEESSVILEARSLKSVLKDLSNNFYRVNQHHIVNMQKIKRINIANRSVLMSNDKEIKVSEHQWVRFKSAYQSVRYCHV